jgi:hypothetical protein
VVMTTVGAVDGSGTVGGGAVVGAWTVGAVRGVVVATEEGRVGAGEADAAWVSVDKTAAAEPMTRAPPITTAPKDMETSEGTN